MIELEERIYRPVTAATKGEEDSRVKQSLVVVADSDGNRRKLKNQSTLRKIRDLNNIVVYIGLVLITGSGLMQTILARGDFSHVEATLHTFERTLSHLQITSLTANLNGEGGQAMVLSSNTTRNHMYCRNKCPSIRELNTHPEKFEEFKFATCEEAMLNSDITIYIFSKSLLEIIVPVEGNPDCSGGQPWKIKFLKIKLDKPVADRKTSLAT